MPGEDSWMCKVNEGKQICQEEKLQDRFLLLCQHNPGIEIALFNSVPDAFETLAGGKEGRRIRERDTHPIYSIG